MFNVSREKTKAGLWGVVAAVLLAVLVVIGSRNLAHFDAALVGYTFATLFAVFGITYRYAMWLQRPPTRMYWRRGWQMFVRPAFIAKNVVELFRRLVNEFALNRFIFRRGHSRWGGHFLIMWGCIIAAAVTFPLVWGWVHFATVPGDLNTYRSYLFGFPGQEFAVDSLFAFVIFHALVWSSFLVIAGVMLAFRRRMIDHGAVAIQQFGEDVLPLLLLFSIAVTGLMLTASYTWLKGYAFDFLTVLHAATVIITLLWLPFGKFFHIFQRPAQLGVSFYKDAGTAGEQANCRRCLQPYTSKMMVQDLERVEEQLGFRYAMAAVGAGTKDEERATHYQQICPQCRRALFGLAQGALWREHLGDRLSEDRTTDPNRVTG